MKLFKNNEDKKVQQKRGKNDFHVIEEIQLGNGMIKIVVPSVGGYGGAVIPVWSDMANGYVDHFHHPSYIETNTVELSEYITYPRNIYNNYKKEDYKDDWVKADNYTFSVFSSLLETYKDLIFVMFIDNYIYVFDKTTKFMGAYLYWMWSKVNNDSLYNANTGIIHDHYICTMKIPHYEYVNHISDMNRRNLTIIKNIYKRAEYLYLSPERNYKEAKATYETMLQKQQNEMKELSDKFGYLSQ